MKQTLAIKLTGLTLIGCKEKASNEKETQAKKVVFNQELANELSKMAEVDQIAAYIPQGVYKKMTNEQWNTFKDSVFTTHQKKN